MQKRIVRNTGPCIGKKYMTKDLKKKKKLKKK